MSKDNLAYLDKITEEQAAYYGVTVEQFCKFSDDLADAQEIIEAEERERIAKGKTGE